VFLGRALRVGAAPIEVMTDQAPVYPRPLEEVVPTARHVSEQQANNRIEADHGRLRPTRGMKTISSMRVVAAGHAFVQNRRRGNYEIANDRPARERVRAGFDELVLCI
jgi:transposase, IS6 family